METKSPRTVSQMVAEAKQQIDNLPPAEVAAALAHGDVTLADLREPEERALSGAIAGAVAAPRGMLEFWADPTSPYHRPEFETSRPVILYCASGGRSALAGATLKQLGYSQVAHLAGGFKAWKAAGQPIESVTLAG